MPPSPSVFVVMGVSGSGKTTIANLLARHLRAEPVIEADDFHPESNKKKMAAGIALDDADRWPWLARLNSEMLGRAGGLTVATCSALKRSYRERLLAGLKEKGLFIFLTAPSDVLSARTHNRKHEYMPPTLLTSQLATLEPPSPEEPAVTIVAADTIEETFGRVLTALEPYFTPR